MKSNNNKEYIKDICMHPSHTPPMHLYIEPGKEYTHTCEGCGKVTVIKSQRIY